MQVARIQTIYFNKVKLLFYFHNKFLYSFHGEIKYNCFPLWKTRAYKFSCPFQSMDNFHEWKLALSQKVDN
jgi:hypothetical protein